MNITTTETTEWLWTAQMNDPKFKKKIVKTVLDSNIKGVKDITDNQLYREVGIDFIWVIPTNPRWHVCQVNYDKAGHFAIFKIKLKQNDCSSKQLTNFYGDMF